ncbi:Gamma-aminobutyric acid receptor subunit beta [Strongyloides ratti]|uniref:Gamma-aminobutyric acid receptor subunit beta n=1 Tax=Strongyloides ratti TaxID=34506 RepID=A0A090L6T2_STRRB|nr:Gamma-aminobutyric acid receptor subunit beta [Strongyloides ratti]CEF65506.1 Gamma-aminobutyric acid receptor subunit beta [Strongyloides ratti]
MKKFFQTFLLFLFLFIYCYGKKNSKFNPTIISKILDHLTNSTRYDKRLRPLYGEEAVEVGITLHISSISAVSEVDMDFTLDFYLRQTYKDNRLAFGEIGKAFKNIKSLTVGVDYLEKLWKPDTFFPNTKKSSFHIATTHNSFLRIEPDGTVFTSQRLTVTATCPMKLKLFPMDSQLCSLEIESYGYSVLDIHYKFTNGKDSVTRSEFELPQFILQDVRLGSKIENLTSGSYSRLFCQFLFKRNIGYYIIQIYLPSILIVIISWVSFWIRRESTPARISLGVLTVLTMTTLMTTTNSTLPKVSYVKSIDIFLGFSFLMVFASLLEYAAVGYMTKRKKIILKRKETKSALINFENKKNLTINGNNNCEYENINLESNDIHNIFSNNITNNKKSLLSYQRNEQDDEEDSPGDNSPQFNFNNSVYNNDIQNHMINNGSLMCSNMMLNDDNGKCSFVVLNPSNIDKYSRITFPFIFLIFNIVYWMTYMSMEDVNWE